MENQIKAQIETDILNILPELGKDKSNSEKKLLIRFTRREFKRGGSVQDNVKLYGQVHADMEVYVFSREDIDMTELFKFYLDKGKMKINDDVVVDYGLQGTEIREGEHLDSDVLKFKVIYPLIDVLDAGTAPGEAVSREYVRMER